VVSPATWTKLGIVAGGGGLPMELAAYCAQIRASYAVSRIAPFADAALASHPGHELNVGEIGARKAALRREGCDAVVMAGIVTRPDFSAVKFDEEGAALVPAFVAAAREGDDALLRVLVDDFERAGFRVVGAHEAYPGLLAPRGVIGAHAPSEEAHADIAKAAAVARALGAWDIAQAVAVCAGLVLAVEAQEGTDGLIARVGALRAAIRGTPQARRGVLLKRPKPNQERRIDLPTIGAATIENAAAAGFAGVAIEAGGALLLDRAALVARADDLGLFLYGFAPDAP
jgi:UDP-2,3-diacylglucosamine hydrolase